MEQNHFKLTRVSHFLWGLNLFFIKRIPVWLFDCCFVLFILIIIFYGFFCAHVPREAGISIWMKPHDEIMKNERKQTRGGGRERGTEDGKIVQKSDSVPLLVPAGFQSVLLIWFWFNRVLTGTLEFDGQLVGAISWFRPHAKLFWVGVSYLYSGEIEHSR